VSIGEPSAPPPSHAPAASAAVGWEARSVAVGVALGFFLGLVAAAAGRSRQAVRSEPIAAALERDREVPTTAPVATAGPTPIGPGPADAQLLADLLAMLQGIDRRLARVEAGCESMRELSERLAAREAAHAEELASQRVAVARLDRAVRRPPLRAVESAGGAPR
jgi:hypothetical protein